MIRDLAQMARQAERNNDWKEASRLWNLLGSQDDVEACEMIIKANELGDLYRNTVLIEIGEEPNKCEDPRAWIKWYDEMSLIYKRIYK